MADTATLFVVSYRPGRRWKPGVPMGQQGLRDHFYYWKALTERGEVEVAGAVGPDQGLVVLRAGSQLEADRMIDQDPAVKAELFVGEAKSFVPRFVGRTLIVPVKP